MQQHCIQYGADILVFDPFQGSATDTVYQPHLFQLQLEQIKKCRNQSEGIYFVVWKSFLFLLLKIIIYSRQILCRHFATVPLLMHSSDSYDLLIAQFSFSNRLFTTFRTFVKKIFFVFRFCLIVLFSLTFVLESFSTFGRSFFHWQFLFSASYN